MTVKLIGFIILMLVAAGSATAEEYHFASIENLVEQEIGRVIIPEIYQKLGIKVSITPLPGNRAQREASNGTKDGEIMRIWSYGNENPSTIRVPTPYYYLETMAFVRKDRGIKISSKSDLKKYRLAKIRGVKHTNNITSGMPSVFDLDSRDGMMKVLQNGRVDIVLTNTIDGSQLIKEKKLTDVVPTGKALAVLELYHYIHSKHKDLVPRVDAVIKRMKASGELEQLVKKAETLILSK